MQSRINWLRVIAIIAVSGFLVPAPQSSSVTSPTQYQVVQRSGGTAGIPVGGVTGETSKVEARWNGGAWETINAAVRGSWSGTLTVAEGQGTVDIRYTTAGSGSVTDYSISPVGAGDIFVIGGQSNAEGVSDYYYSYSGTPFMGLFGNDYTWKAFVEPYDDNTGQLDSVSASVTKGSIWGIVGAVIIADQGVPVAFVPAPLTGTTALQWQPSANHVDRTTLYGSLNYRASVTGCKGIIFILGESDVKNGTDKATFKTRVNAIIDALFADRGVKVMFNKVVNTPSYDETNVNDAIGEIWAENANAMTGADFHVITPDDEYHWKTQAKTEQAAALMIDAILAAWYP